MVAHVCDAHTFTAACTQRTSAARARDSSLQCDLRVAVLLKLSTNLKYNVEIKGSAAVPCPLWFGRYLRPRSKQSVRHTREPFEYLEEGLFDFCKNFTKIN